MYPSGLRITTLNLYSAAKGYTVATIGSNPIITATQLPARCKSAKRDFRYKIDNLIVEKHEADP